MSNDDAGQRATSRPVDLLRIDPHKPESIMSEGEKRIPELVMQERIRQLEADLEAMTKARDYEKEAHARSVAYYTARSETTSRWIPVGERLPEKAGQYLTAVKPVLEDEAFVKVQTFMPQAHPGLSGWRVGRVTHWMPFPNAQGAEPSVMRTETAPSMEGVKLWEEHGYLCIRSDRGWLLWNKRLSELGGTSFDGLLAEVRANKMGYDKEHP